MREVVARLCEEAREANERRLLVIAGDADETRSAAHRAIDAAGLDGAAVTAVGPAPELPGEVLDPRRSDRLLGTTRDAVVVDCHEACRPNVLGRAVGAVDGGGLLILLVPPLRTWPERRDDFDATLAVPPFDRSAVAGNFRTRLVNTLRAHPGIAFVRVDGEETTIRRDGLTEPAPRLAPPAVTVPADHAFPAATYEACLTADQAEAVTAFEGFLHGEGAVVLEADRGRGKSSAAGLAGAALALAGRDVLVTAPGARNAEELFARAHDLLDGLEEIADCDDATRPRRLETQTGRVRYAEPATAVCLPDDPDLVVVDEAAAIPVRRLEQFLAADRVAFATTVHGYEGAGRGFSVRFRDRLAESDLPVTDVSLATPIRYAPGDPVELWAFRALCLGARPAADPLVAGADPETVEYRALAPEELLADDHLLEEVFGLLVLAHYRTEPNDLARLLDAPNVAVRALLADGHVASIALLAREGDLPASLRADMYEGARVRGNMIPDVLTSQLRDEAAGDPVGWRIMRIATHHAVRSCGLGSHLLGKVRNEVGVEVDWLGAGFGATPELVQFWRTNGFHAVHLSTTRNDTSGEHSAVVLDPCSHAGEALLKRHTDWFLDRVPSMLADPLDGLDPDVVRETLRSIDGRADLALSPTEWRHVTGIPHGAAIFDTAPRTVRRLVLRHLTDPGGADRLTARQERLLVRKALQARPWDEVTAAMGYHSRSTCMRAFGEAVAPLVAAYGGSVSEDERRRFE